MENLNAKQVKKWLEVCAEDTPYPDQRQALLDTLSLIKQLTEENEKLVQDVTRLVQAKTEVAKQIFEEIEKIINEPFAVGFDLLSPLKQALGDYDNGIRKDLLYYIADLKKKYQ